MGVDVDKEDVPKSDQHAVSQERVNASSVPYLAPLMVPLDFDREVRSRLAYWQRWLRLQDWAITVTYWPHKALGHAVAHVEWNLNDLSAELALRIPTDIAPIERDWGEGEAGDYDRSIVHELLHLKCLPIRGQEESGPGEEQLCNHVASALVDLSRGHDHQQGPPTPPLAGNPPTPQAAGGAGHYL